MTPAMLEELLAVATEKKVEFKKELYEKDLRFIKAFAKAYIARSLWGNEGSSRVMLMEDVQFKKAESLFPEAEKISKNLSQLR
jgi:hypothetical protein